MYFTDISYVVHPVGRVTPNGVTLLGTAFFINRRGLLATAAHVTGNNDSEVVANKWLTATIPTNVPFGTQKSPSIFYEKVLDEIEAFFTGDEKYKDSRLAILKESGVVQSYVVGGISIALAPVLGTSAPFLAPVIAIVLLTIGKIGLNAWLATRREKREKKSNPEK